MDDITEIALESPHRLLLCVSTPPCVCVDLLGTGLEAKLCNSHAMQHRVHASVATTVEPMPPRLILALSGGRGERRGSIESSEASLGEAARVANLDQELACAARREAAQVSERRAGYLDQVLELAHCLTLAQLESSDGLGMIVEQTKPQVGRRVVGAAAITSAHGGQPRAHLLGSRQAVTHVVGKLAKQRLGLVQQLLAELDDRPSLLVPQGKKLGGLVWARV